MRLLALVLSLVWLASAALAGVRGQSDPAFDRAMQAWLKADDLAALLKERGAALAAHPLFAPFSDLMRTACEADTEIELATLQGLYRNFPVALLAQSPVEALLPTETYQASPRFAVDFSRKVKTSGMAPDRLATLLPCTTSLE